MKSILQELHSQGIPEEKALTSLFVIHQWLEKNYPVLGVVSKSTLFKEVLSVSSQEVEGEEVHGQQITVDRLSLTDNR